MSSPATLPRPRQVTMAAWLIMGGSLLVLLSVFDRMAGLNSLDTRDAISLFLSEPPGDALGWTVSEVVTLIEVLTMVAGACAAAAAILGYHVLRRHRGARIALTVLAVPLFLTGFATGGFLSSVVAASALMLWLEPSRDWFAGRPAREQPSRRDRTGDRAPERRAEDRGRTDVVAPPEPSPGPRAHQGFGTPVAAPSSDQEPPADMAGQAPPHQPAPYQPGPYGQPVSWTPAPTPPRPGAVLAAAVVTWVTTGLVSLLLAMSALVMLVSPELVMEEVTSANPAFAESGIGQRDLQVAVVVMAVVVILWSAAAAVFAGLFLLRRRDWARVALIISTSVAAVLCVAALFTGGFPMLVPLAACVATLTLLLRRDVRAWATAP